MSSMFIENDQEKDIFIFRKGAFLESKLSIEFTAMNTTFHTSILESQRLILRDLQLQ
jgi:hypothetical protein